MATGTGTAKRPASSVSAVASELPSVATTVRPPAELSSDLKLNPHFHAVFLAGAYGAGADGKPVFGALPRLSTSAAADVLKVVRVRILGYLKRHGVVEAGAEATVVDDGLAEREPALAQLAAAAVSGLPPAGPELRRRPEIPLRGRPGVVITAPLSVTEMGFSLHGHARRRPRPARPRHRDRRKARYRLGRAHPWPGGIRTRWTTDEVS